MNIRPLTDLRTNMAEIMQEVKTEDVIYLTKNGRGSCVLQDWEKYNNLIKENEKQKETIRLLAKLAKSEQSAKEQGFVDFEDFVQELGIDE